MDMKIECTISQAENNSRPGLWIKLKSDIEICFSGFNPITFLYEHVDSPGACHGEIYRPHIVTVTDMNWINVIRRTMTH